VIKTIGLLTLEQLVALRHEAHAPLSRAVPAGRRYVQSHLLAELTRPDIPATDVDIDGIAELWY
jgi:hypothetical protein